MAECRVVVSCLAWMLELTLKSPARATELHLSSPVWLALYL